MSLVHQKEGIRLPLKSGFATHYLKTQNRQIKAALVEYPFQRHASNQDWCRHLLSERYLNDFLIREAKDFFEFVNGTGWGMERDGVI